MLPATLKQYDFKELQIPETDLKLSDFKRSGDTAEFTISSDCYAHAVHFNLKDDICLSDEYFDILPGERRKIEIYGIGKEFKVDEIEPQYISIQKYGGCKCRK